jgi:hypothetical protein
MKYLKSLTVILSIAFLSAGCSGGSLSGGSSADSEGDGTGASAPIAAQMEVLQSIDTILEKVDLTASDPAFASASVVTLPSIGKALEMTPAESEDEDDGAEEMKDGIQTLQMMRYDAFLGFMRVAPFLKSIEAALDDDQFTIDDSGISGSFSGLLRAGSSENLSLEGISSEWTDGRFEVLLNSCTSGSPSNRVSIRPGDGIEKTKVFFFGQTNGMMLRAMALVGDSESDTEFMGCAADEESYVNCIKFRFNEDGSSETLMAGELIIDEEDGDDPMSIEAKLISNADWTSAAVWFPDDGEGESVDITTAGPNYTGEIATRNYQELSSRPEDILSMGDIVAATNLAAGFELLAPFDLEALAAMNEGAKSKFFRKMNGDLHSCPNIQDIEELPRSIENKVVHSAENINRRSRWTSDDAIVARLKTEPRGLANGEGFDFGKLFGDDDGRFPAVSYSLNSCDDIVGTYEYHGDDEHSTIEMSEWINGDEMGVLDNFCILEEDCTWHDGELNRTEIVIRDGRDGCTQDSPVIMQITSSSALHHVKSDDRDENIFLKLRSCDDDGCTDEHTAHFECDEGSTIAHSDKLTDGSCDPANPWETGIKANVRIQNSGDDDFSTIDLILFDFQDGLGSESTDLVARFTRTGGGGGDEGDSIDTWGSAVNMELSECNLTQGMYAYLNPSRTGSKSSTSVNLWDSGDGEGWFLESAFSNMNQFNDSGNYEDVLGGTLCIVCDETGTLASLAIRDCSAAATLDDARIAPSVLQTAGALETVWDGDTSYIQNFDGDGEEFDAWVHADISYVDADRRTDEHALKTKIIIEKTAQMDYDMDGDVHIYIHSLWDANEDMEDGINDGMSYNTSAIHDDVVLDFVRVGDLPDNSGDSPLCYALSNGDPNTCATWLQGSCTYVDGVGPAGEPGAGETFDYDVLFGYFQSTDNGGLGLEASAADALIACLADYDGAYREGIETTMCIPVEVLDGASLEMMSCHTP